MDIKALLLFFMFVVAAATAALMLIIKTSAKHRRLKPLSVLAFVLMILGILFSGEPIKGYGLISLGILITVVSLIKLSKLPSMLERYSPWRGIR
ncbi:MAG: hypothetical protein EOO03_03145 [Chitinophagaceae bacterium]|nr:MAG: hypothetical protein EOO03_03145 [Chitinophagaceae bacterium]